MGLFLLETFLYRRVKVENPKAFPLVEFIIHILAPPPWGYFFHGPKDGILHLLIVYFRVVGI